MRNSQQALLQAIPSDWGTAPLAEIASIHSGSTPKREVTAYWGGDIPWVTPGELTGLGAKYLTDTAERITAAGLASCSATLVPPNALLVTTRATLGSAALAAMHVATNQGFRSLVFSDRADPNFYYHLAPLLVSELTRRASGTTFLEISGREFGSVRVPLPPLSEQRRIAEILDTLDEAIRGTEQVIAKLQQMKQGLLHDLLTRGIDENGELRDPARHPEQFKDTALGSIPQAWDVVHVGTVFQMQLGKMLSKEASNGKNPRPYLANRHIQWDYVDLSDLDTMSFSPDEAERFTLMPGDLLVCEGGEVGRTALWRGEGEGVFFQKAVHRLRPRDGRVLPEFMLRFMRFAADRGFFTELLSQTSIAHLTQEKLALLRMPLPPAAEQRRLVDVWDAADNRQSAELGELKKLRALKQGLADDLLTGRVRVPTAQEAAP